MTKHRKGSIIGLIGLLIILVAAGFIFFSMISDQIFFKKVNEVEKVQHVNVTLDKAAAKQIDNYTSQQVSNKNNNAWRDASASEIKGAFSGVSQPCFFAYSAPVLIGSSSKAPTP